ncbi:MAG: hypothetical protein MUP81_00195 [Dehalococcoidia bacterium]|nr:hypothetical protein [Dehalococcoidia bacterium]
MNKLILVPAFKLCRKCKCLRSKKSKVCPECKGTLEMVSILEEEVGNYIETP